MDKSLSDRNANRSTTPKSSEFQTFISEHWDTPKRQPISVHPGAEYAATRRKDLAATFPDSVLIIPAGHLKVRSNDTDYPFRAHSAFAYLTAWGSQSEADSVLVIDTTDGYRETLYFREKAGRDSEEFYANPQIGEFWIGPRPSLAEAAEHLDISCEPLQNFSLVIENTNEHTYIVPEADLRIQAIVDETRLGKDLPNIEYLEQQDQLLAQTISEARLVKDEWEVEELRKAIAATHKGFSDIIAQMPTISEHDRGERLIEGIFYTRARAEGNAAGYDTIAASGPNACILHWTKNTGKVDEGDLVLIDAGIEMESLYTADITRTLPVSGRFSEVQKMVYEAVLEAADAAFAIVRPGIIFREVHEAAMAVIAEKTAEWGFLPVTADVSLKPDKQYHRRYMVHGTSHHLGLDVHDCAKARREMYMDGEIREGMVFTIEPGLYFQADDLSVPEEFRGIGIRIEDNILVTAKGAENLSIAIPRTVAAVEEWMTSRVQL